MADESIKNMKNETPSEKKEEKEQLFDLLLPPGVPRKIIADVIRQFDVELIERKKRLYFANMDGDERDLLAFRGRREEVEKAEKFIFKELQEFIGEN
nr:hypothetical protein [uncultured bacterium]